jgi:pilus assembly protein CpaF
MTRASAVDTICASVRDEDGDLAELIHGAVRRIAPLATSLERRSLFDDAYARLAGLGELDALLADTTVDEVLVNGDEIWVDRDGRLVRVGQLEGTSVHQLIERILAPIGRRVDRSSPIVDARLPDGSRVCAVVPPVAVGGAALSIRRFSDSVRELHEFTDDIGAELLGEIVRQRCNVVVCGPTSSGKTSLLGALLSLIDDEERLVVLEDTSELPCRVPHVVRLESRPHSVEGPSPVTLSALVRTALRLRPDRLVVGEVRSDECLALVQAMNTGHDGSLSTCHANGPLDALLRLESLVVQAAPQWPLSAVRQQLRRSIDVIIHVRRVGARRRIVEVGEVVPPGVDDTDVPGTRVLAQLEADGLTRIGHLGRGRR